MADILFANNAASTLASAISNSDTSITVQSADAAEFPSPTGSQYFMVTITDGTNIEILKCTARSGSVLTCTRAQEGTSASAFSAGASIENRLTKESLEALRDFTVEDTQVIGRLDELGKTITSWDDATASGFYNSAAGATNEPTNHNYAGLAVGILDTNNVIQLATRYGSAGDSDTLTYMRIKSGGSWTAWFALQLSGTEQAALYAAASHTHSQSDITNLVTDLAAKVDNTITVTGTGSLTGGGDLSANRTIDANLASQAQAEAGTNAVNLMTPERTAQAIAALSDLVFIGAHAISDDASIDITGLGSDYAAHLFVGVNIDHVQNNATLRMRTSTDNGATWDSGASDYVTTLATATSAQLTDSLGDADDGTYDFHLWLYNPSAAKRTSFHINGKGINSTGVPILINTVGHRDNAEDVDAVQFFMSSGNLTSGTIYHFALKNA